MYGVDEPVEVVLALHALGALDPALAQLRGRGKWELRSLVGWSARRGRRGAQRACVLIILLLASRVLARTFEAQWP